MTSMKKMLSIIILLVLPSVSPHAFSQNDKVLICHKGKEVSVAVRSSATAEDLPTASFAGQQASYIRQQLSAW